MGSSCRQITSPGTPGSRREGEDGCEQVELIITSIHLHWTPALFYEGASECGPTFDESPLKISSHWWIESLHQSVCSHSSSH